MLTSAYDPFFPRTCTPVPVYLPDIIVYLMAFVSVHYNIPGILESHRWPVVPHSMAYAENPITLSTTIHPMMAIIVNAKDVFLQWLAALLSPSLAARLACSSEHHVMSLYYNRVP